MFMLDIIEKLLFQNEYFKNEIYCLILQELKRCSKQMINF
jgi:hypothetical protein